MRSITGFVLAFALFGWHSIGMGHEKDAPSSQAISLQGTLGQSHQAKVYRDESSRLDFQQIRRLPANQWTDLTSSIAEGFTTAAIWIHFQLPQRHSDEAGEWFLELNQPLLADVRLYSLTSKGNIIERFGSTLSDAQKRELNYRYPTFVLKDQIDSAYWIRISTPTALQTSLNLYKANQLMAKHARNDFVWGIVFGTYLLIVIFYFAFSLRTRERLHLYYTSYIFINFLAALFTSGWPLQYFEGMTSNDHIKYLGIWVSLSLTTGTLMSAEFLQMKHRHPITKKMMLTIAIVFTTIGLIGAIRNQYASVIPYVQVTSLFLILCFMLLAIVDAIKGDRISRIFLLAFSLFYIGVIWRYMRNFGIFESNFWSDNSYQLGAFAHMLIMSTTIFARYNNVVKEKKQVQLQLQYESQIRTSQGKFVDMVSHEFRTPLSVVKAALGNLMVKHASDNETLTRLQRIERASERMQDLIHNYLNTERTILNTHTPNLSKHNIASICRLAVEDLNEENRRQIIQNLAVTPDVICDIDLIRIAILNLLENACKHSMSSEPIHLSTMVNDGCLRIEIADTGQGIKNEELEHIFERHYRGSGSHAIEGSGLGLYIVQSIAMSHQGRVSVRDNLPSGCVFALDLPL